MKKNYRNGVTFNKTRFFKTKISLAVSLEKLELYAHAHCKPKLFSNDTNSEFILTLLCPLGAQEEYFSAGRTAGHI
jgi:hypothetical protein